MQVVGRGVALIQRGGRTVQETAGHVQQLVAGLMADVEQAVAAVAAAGAAVAAAAGTMAGAGVGLAAGGLPPPLDVLREWADGVRSRADVCACLYCTPDVPYACFNHVRFVYECLCGIHAFRNPISSGKHLAPVTTLIPQPPHGVHHLGPACMLIHNVTCSMEGLHAPCP